MEITAQVVVVAKKSEGKPKESDFRVETRKLPPLKENEFLYKSLYISPDPYQRIQFHNLKEGDTMVGSVVAEVIESKHPKFKPGDIVVPYKGWVTHGIMGPDDNLDKLHRHDPSLGPISTAVGVLGMTGMTAYLGFQKVCQPKEGETVVVSGAAGAVGSLVGQIAKIKKCTVIGFAGSDEKCDYIKSLGFDHAFNYKTCGNIKSVLDKVCPDGVDCFFDNTGGEIQDAVLQSIKPFARIAICGQISNYDTLDKPSLGPRLLHTLIYKAAVIQGFLIFNWMDEWPEGLKQMSEWIKEGKIKYEETVVEGGIEVTPKAFIAMLSGENVGKQLVKITTK